MEKENSCDLRVREICIKAAIELHKCLALIDPRGAKAQSLRATARNLRITGRAFSRIKELSEAAV